MLARCTLAALAALAGCGDRPFQPAAHPALERGNIPKQSGPILAHVRLATVTFAGYEHEQEVEALGAWLPTSSWWTTVGAEYGIAAGTDLGHVVLADVPPSDVTPEAVGALLAGRVRDGTLPSSPDTGLEADTVYVVYYPPSTTLHLVAGDAGCAEAGGFHFAYSDGSLIFAFAAIPSNCASQATGLGLSPLELIEFDASHEIIEAASDPYSVATNGVASAAGPAAWRLSDPTNPWFALGGEIADACTSRCVVDSGFTVQRVWSNAAATAGDDPCIPSNGPWFAAAPASDAPVSIAAGTSRPIEVIGASTEPVDRWSVDAIAGAFFSSSFVPSAAISPQQLGNAEHATLTVTVPPGTPAGSQGIVMLRSEPQPDGHPLAYANWWLWPVLVTTR